MGKSEPTIGVRALRARLSAYLREAARGKTVTISDRRRQPVARLVPIVRSADDEILDRLAAFCSEESASPFRSPSGREKSGASSRTS